MNKHPYTKRTNQYFKMAHIPLGFIMFGCSVAEWLAVQCVTDKRQPITRELPWASVLARERPAMHSSYK